MEPDQGNAAVGGKAMTTTPWPFGDLKMFGYGAIYCDPPWRYEVWSGETAVKARDSARTYTSANVHYQTMSAQELSELPVADLAAENCVLLMWVTWPTLEQALRLMGEWGFAYKTCGFSWMKAKANQIELFDDDMQASMGMGYWTRANSEVCLLATKGKPKRLNADVRQSIISPRREHSRKPEGVHRRIERLVAGPYCELFGRQRRQGWDTWGLEVDKFSTEPSALHPLNDSAKLGGSSVPFEVVAPPTQDLNVCDGVPVNRTEAVNAG